jgi:hypothetical protein
VQDRALGQKPKYPPRADASAFHPTSDIRRDRRQADPASSTTAFTVTGFGTGRGDSAMAPHALARDGRGSGRLVKDRIQRAPLLKA